MKHFLVLFACGILCENTLARRFDNPILNDFERRLVRLVRQFTESENLEHRMLQLEIHLGNIKVENTLETNSYKISRSEEPTEGMTFHQRLESVERNWVEKLEVHLRELFSKHENLSERLSAIERQFREAQRKASLSEITKESEELEQQEFSSVKPNTKPETGLEYSEELGSGNGESEPESGSGNGESQPESGSGNGESQPESGSGNGELQPEFGSGNGELQPEFGSGYSQSEVEMAHSGSGTLRKIGSNYYFVERNEEKKKTWKSAVAYCKQMNSHLVSLQDDEDWNAKSFTSLNPSRTYWIVNNDRSTEGKMVPEFTEKTDPFLKLAVDEPSSSPGDEDCVELKADKIFRMKDAECLAKNFYVCKINL